MKFLLITVLFFSANISALTQYEFVQRLKSTHPFFKQQALIGQIRQIEKQASSANEDWILAANSDLQNDNSTRTNTIKFSARKKIVSLGSELIFAKTLSKKNQNSERRNQFSVDYSHPLLRNSNGVNDRLDGDIAQISIDKNRLQRAEAEEDFILQNLQRLVNLAYAQERQRINAQRLTLAGQELDLVRQKFNASVVDKVDVLSQQDAYQSAEQQLFLAQQDLLSLQSEVAIILNIEPDFAIAEIDIYTLKYY
ncbi:MAG: TolC family protein [Candidatus Thioglobus sp.]|nr:TolC family protein [Candidatus Thioglobus sp.]